MVAPRLAPLRNVLPTASAEAEVFVVVDEGMFGGRRWRLGDVVVCGEATPESPVVLVARGHGRPRLGTVTGDEVRGDAGEPCSRERWQVAGRVMEVRWGGEAVADACRRHGARARRTELGGGVGRGAGAPWPSRRGGRDGHTPGLAPVRLAPPQLALFDGRRAA